MFDWTKYFVIWFYRTVIHYEHYWSNPNRVLFLPGVSTKGVSLEATGAASFSDACESPGPATLKVGTFISNSWDKTLFCWARRKIAKDNTLAVVDFMMIFFAKRLLSHTHTKNLVRKNWIFCFENWFGHFATVTLIAGYVCVACWGRKVKLMVRFAFPTFPFDIACVRVCGIPFFSRVKSRAYVRFQSILRFDFDVT